MDDRSYSKWMTVLVLCEWSSLLCLNKGSCGMLPVSK